MRKIIPIITIILLITTQVTAQKKFDSAKDTIQIDQLVITGTHISSPASTIPASISVVPREVIERSNESSILSILSGYVPGLFVTERGTTGYGVYSGSAGGITMRGVGASPTTQVRITVDVFNITH